MPMCLYITFFKRSRLVVVFVFSLESFPNFGLSLKLFRSRKECSVLEFIINMIRYRNAMRDGPIDQVSAPASKL